MTQIGSVSMLCIGRFLCGITAGIANNIMGKSLDETIPVESSGQFGTLLNGYICIGFIPSFLLGGILPTGDEEMKDDNRWRLIYLMPAFIAITQILLFLIFFKEEPVAFSIAEGNEEEAKTLLKKVYKKTENFDELIDEHYTNLTKSTPKDVSNVSLNDAAYHAQYRKATWIGVGIFSFQQLSGINGVIPYTNRLLVSIKESSDGKFPISPLVGAYFMAFMQAIGALLAYIPITYFGRKPILMFGQFAMAVSFFFAGLSIIMKWYTAIFVFLNLFILSF